MCRILTASQRKHIADVRDSYFASLPSGAGVFGIVNKVLRKIWIGSAFDVAVCMFEHFARLSAGTSNLKLVQKDWDKYGEDQFEFKVLLFCSSPVDRQRWEYLFRTKLRANNPKYGYNVRLNNPKYLNERTRPMTEETRAVNGQKHLVFTRKDAFRIMGWVHAKGEATKSMTRDEAIACIKNELRIDVNWNILQRVFQDAGYNVPFKARAKTPSTKGGKLYRRIKELEAHIDYLYEQVGGPRLSVGELQSRIAKQQAGQVVTTLSTD